MKGKFVDTGLCDCRETCAAQADICLLGRERLLLKFIFSVFVYVAQQNKFPQGKRKRQIINSFQYLSYISKELLIFLCYGYT